MKKSIQPIPVLVLTGFLGSGKTTLLNNLLRQMPDSAVIINEFGAIPIDPEILRTQDIPISTLAGGCMCCQVRDAVAPVLKNLRMAWEAGAEKRFGRIIIEASGVADPEPVLDVLLRPGWLSARYRLQGVIATVSAVQGRECLARFAVAQAQIAWADTVVITHTDLADGESIDDLEKRLRRLSAAARYVRADSGRLDAGGLGLRRLRPVPMKEAASPPDHGFGSAALQFRRPLPWTRAEPVLKRLVDVYREHLVRLKGVIFDPAYDHPLLVQGSAGLLHPVAHLPARAGDDGVSRLVFITEGPIEKLIADATHALEAVCQ